MEIRFRKLNDKAVVPTKAHATDAGFDLTATSRSIDEYGNIIYGTGIAVEIPQVEFIEVEELSDSDRGEGGYGSSGE